MNTLYVNISGRPTQMNIFSVCTHWIVLICKFLVLAQSPKVLFHFCCTTLCLYVALELWCGLPCLPILYEYVQPCTTIKGETGAWHALIQGAVEGHIRSGPGKRLFMAWQQALYMPYTSHIKQTHTHTNMHTHS